MTNHDKVKQAFFDVSAPEGIAERTVAQAGQQGYVLQQQTQEHKQEEYTATVKNGKYYKTNNRMKKMNIFASVAVFAIVAMGLFAILLASGNLQGSPAGFGSDGDGIYIGSDIEQETSTPTIDPDSTDAEETPVPTTAPDTDGTSIEETPMPTLPPDRGQNAIEPVVPLPDEYITVSTPQELYDAIAPGAYIVLSEGIYDLSTITETGNEYVSFIRYGSLRADKAGMIISSTDGLTLRAQEDAKVEIVTPDKFAEVLLFEFCKNISIIGIEAGHSLTGPYECDNGVLFFENSTNITVADSFLYGCGSIGITMVDCNFAKVSNTIVTDCSLRAVDLSNSHDILFSDCAFIDNRAYGNVINGRDSTAAFYNCEISGNKQLVWSPVVSFTGYALFDSCVFNDNALEQTSGEELVFDGLGIKLINCYVELGSFSYYWVYGVTDLGGNTLN